MDIKNSLVGYKNYVNQCFLNMNWVLGNEEQETVEPC